MPALKDASTAVGRVGLFRFLLRIWKQIDEDNVFVWAAALAYSWMFAIFPFLIFLLTLIPYVPESQKDQVIEKIHHSIYRSLPSDAAKMLDERVSSTLERVMNSSHGGLMSIGLILTLWAASGGMAMTMSALDRCYDVDINRPFYKQRPIAILLTIGVSLLLLMIILLLPVGTLILAFVWKTLHLPQSWRMILDVARWAVALLLMTMLLNLVYHFGTQVKQRFRALTPGAVFCIVVWVGLGFAFRYYVNRFAAGSYDRTYGAVGGVVVLLLLFYLDALVLLIGAEINSEIDFEVLGVPQGSMDLRRKDSPSLADPTMPSP